MSTKAETIGAGVGKLKISADRDYLINVTVLFSVDVFYIDEQKLCLKITLG